MKTIVILSSEPWGKMMLSKMHYAIELARRGNKVFFVNPPRKAAGRRICYEEKIHDLQNITVIHVFETRLRLMLREKFFFFYPLLEKRYLKSLVKITGRHDELWCFNPQFIVHTAFFHADVNLLFMYDFYRTNHLKITARQSDVVISVAQNILDYFDDVDKPKLLLNHGLSYTFQQATKKYIPSRNDKIKLGYVGNLLRGAIDIGAFQSIISSHPEIEFHIWGPVDLKENNVSGIEISDQTLNFIRFLKQTDNVILRGVKTTDVLAEEIQDMDIFLFIYSSVKDINGASNSHKLLEYLSTGKVVISTFVSHYEGSDLLVMDKKNGNDFPQFFDSAIKKIEEYNSPENQMRRQSFALDNTYEKQVNRIYEFIEREKILRNKV